MMTAISEFSFDLPKWLDRVVQEYVLHHPEENPGLSPLREALASGANLASRRTMPLHLTASAVVLDTDGTHVLLLLHRKLGIWVQPGGHLRPGESPPQAATRELEEECKLSDARLEGGDELPLDIDIHRIEAIPSKEELAHWHCDFRYVFRSNRVPVVLSNESRAAEWVRRGIKLGELTQGRMERIVSKLNLLHPIETSRPLGDRNVPYS
jgi:8-oxo-dGTP pyrophosphatase MutT (NUDIX family)